MFDVVNEALCAALREDQGDYAATHGRKSERALGYGDFAAELKANGAL